MHGVKIVNDAAVCVVENCFFHPDKWTEEDKVRYAKWLATVGDDHPSQTDKSPWQKAALETEE